MSEKIRAHIFVSGLVQGVFFRANTRKKAQELEVTGWVKNLSDGRIESIFEGEKDNVEKIVEWAKRGTPPARVDDVETEWQEYKGEFKDFHVRYF